MQELVTEQADGRFFKKIHRKLQNLDSMNRERK